MDIINVTIPDTVDADSKKRVAESHSEEGYPTKRLRADTTTLIAAKPTLYDPPYPEKDLTRYSQSRLQEGLAFVNQALKKQNITPRTKTFLSLHKNALKVALEDAEPAQSTLATVQTFESIYMSEAFYFAPRDENAQKHLDAYLKLRRLELLAQYGDYLSLELANFKARLLDAVKQDRDNINLREAHSEIAKRKVTQLAEELSKTDINALKTGVYVACDVLGIGTQHLLTLINLWSERRTAFHNEVKQNVENCKWLAVSTNIHRDLRELTNVWPMSDYEEDPDIKCIRTSISRLRDSLFTVLDEDEPAGWLPNALAAELSTVHAARKKKKSGQSFT